MTAVPSATAQSRPTAIVVGAEPRIVVTVTRSLARAGVRCVVVVPPGQTFRVSSRSIASVVRFHGTVADAATLLRMLAASERASWITPTSDAALAILAHDYGQLVSICPVGAPPPHVVERVLDKSQTMSAAERCGIPVPRSVVVRSAADLPRVLSELRFPVVAKPWNKTAVQSHGFKTRTFESGPAVLEAFPDPAASAGLAFQEYARGVGVGVELLMRRGDPLARFQHRRLAELPPAGGVAVVAASEAPDTELVGQAVRLLRELEWEGVAMVEFRHCATTGETALMEVNGRFWGSIALPVAAGVDFPLYAWQVAQRLEPTPPESYPVGLRIRWTAGALKRISQVRAAGAAWNAPGESAGCATGSTMSGRGFFSGARSALWSWSDPLPALQEGSDVIAAAGRATVKAIARRIIPPGALTILKTARELPSGRGLHYVARQAKRSTGRESTQQLPHGVGSVLFVCHGNIMRSAAAAQFLRDQLAASGMDSITVTSAGTTTRAGRPADRRVQAAVASFGTSLAAHASQPVSRDLVDSADVIFAMDDLNVVNLASSFPHARGKIRLLGGMTSTGTWNATEIVDPYHATDAEVQATISRIHSCVAALSQALQRSGRSDGVKP